MPVSARDYVTAAWPRHDHIHPEKN